MISYDVEPLKAKFKGEFVHSRPTLFLNNTLTRRKEPFSSREDKLVKIFTCGPSVYRRPHIGNYRTFLFEDVLVRYLEYLGHTVNRLINITDVEDKAVAEAQQKHLTLRELTQPVIDRFLEESSLLGIKLPEQIPRASTTVDQAVHLIKILLEKGYAYWHEGDVFYDPLKFEGFGKLFGLDMSKWPKAKIRFRRDTYPGERWNLGDFILWHGYKEGSGDEGFFWDTEIGRGRPAWNIQDPAMITKYLGYEIDISAGGVDNLYRHHDYTIAVMEAVTGTKFAQYWLHAEHVLVDGKKMSKSSGNEVFPENIFSRGYTPAHLRFYLIYGHYRERCSYTMDRFNKTSSRLNSFREMARSFAIKGEPPHSPHGSGIENDLTAEFERYMNDDLNVQGAFDALYQRLTDLMVTKGNNQLEPGTVTAIGEALQEIDSVLQVIL